MYPSPYTIFKDVGILKPTLDSFLFPYPAFHCNDFHTMQFIYSSYLQIKCFLSSVQQCFADDVKLSANCPCAMKQVILGFLLHHEICYVHIRNTAFLNSGSVSSFSLVSPVSSVYPVYPVSPVSHVTMSTLYPLFFVSPVYPVSTVSSVSLVYSVSPVCVGTLVSGVPSLLCLCIFCISCLPCLPCLHSTP